LKDLENTDLNCTDVDKNSNVRYVDVIKDDAGTYFATPVTAPARLNAIDGIPPYGFVQVRFPVFIPNENIKDELGLMELIAVSEAVDPNTGAVTGDD
jgi:hypothetical protein